MTTDQPTAPASTTDHRPSDEPSAAAPDATQHDTIDRADADDAVPRFTARTARFTAVLDGAAGSWDAPTPCDGWTVRDVVEHVVSTERDFLGRHGVHVGEALATTDPAAAWREHLTAVTEGLSREVAARGYDGWFGPTTIGDTMADFYGWDLVVHSWDVARATSQEWVIDEEEVRSMSATTDGWGEALYSEGICTAPVDVPDDASGQDRLLARLGRDPYWSR
ncbi:TIGR03086 family metal-binding protein [Auraticoccus monumenti]|uniref:TIGR03086 family protein n=1 Tax=Auraticoccus monumenti TaxID=675864 RepID=A0A1G7ABC0_9ACTN|nr:TIGR03086 family metal-binding protein [Auraticoccus monumenti]SDE11973.1 TIGR03086 family protein [Auraticoccus monumenti]